MSTHMSTTGTETNQLAFPASNTSLATTDTKACPFCGEGVLAIAKKCKHCGEMLDAAMRLAQQTATVPSGAAAASSSTTVVVHTHGRSFPHLLHLLLTVFTLGLWFPLWVLHYLFRGSSYR